MDHAAAIMDVSPNTLPFSDRVALVAGCAGTTGLAIAEALAKQGAMVYLAAGLVMTPEQRWRLSEAGPGMCVVMPALRTSVGLSEEFGQREQHLHILVASAEAMPALALAHQEFLLRGSGGADDPAHVVALGHSVASSALAELNSEGLVVDSVDPQFRFGGTQEAHVNDVASMILSMCEQTGAQCLPSLHEFEEFPEHCRIPAPASAKPFLMAKL